MNKNSITVETIVSAPVSKAWQVFTDPKHVVAWNSASEDWHTPLAENDLRTGGTFRYRMEAKDGSQGFDFEGVYDDVTPMHGFSYSMSDGRKVKVTFSEDKAGTRVTETFDPENENPADMQRAGWQAILDNFKKYTEK